MGDSVSESPRHKHSGQPPVSTHPAFPVIVALWFAALLGIGSMVLPIDLFERFAVASGLADIFQAAQPPLGATARIVVAMVAGVIGAIAGTLVAGRIRAANAPRTATRHAAAQRPADESHALSAKQPISAHEELGEGGLDADPDAPGEGSVDADLDTVVERGPLASPRRELVMTDDDAPSEFLDVAPLPGHRAAAFGQQFGEPLEQPLDLDAFGAAETEPVSETSERFEPSSHTADFEEPAAAVPLGERAIGDLGLVELVERFASALQRHREQTARPAEPPLAGARASAHSDAPDDIEWPTPAALPSALRPIGYDDDGEDDEAELAPPFDLPTAFAQGRGAFDHDADPEADELEDVAEEEYTSLLAMKSPLGLSREPLRFEDDDADDEPVAIFPGQANRPAAAHPASSDPIAESRPFDAPLARAEQAGQPAVFKPANTGATEHALREALERLQKLSGAA